MKLRTEVQIPPTGEYIDYEQAILSLGSCFATAMGSRLQHYKFPIHLNPFGVIFNPISISSILQKSFSKNATAPLLIFHQGIWHGMDYHGSFHHKEKAVLEARIKASHTSLQNGLDRKGVLLISLGTAWVYEWKETGQIVANCHKIPQSRFNKRLLEIDEIVSSFSTCFNELISRFHELKVIISVSPVRHIKDGIHENQLSKSTLLLAVEKLSELFPFVHYFPAYEIVLDELRSYRFFKEDMIHPSQQAETYIWEKFSSAWIAPEAQVIMRDIQPLIFASNHIIKDALSSENQKFIHLQLQKIVALQNKYPHLDFKEELAYFESLK